MIDSHTTELSQLQPFCKSSDHISFVASENMKLPNDPGKAGLWTKAQREMRKLSGQDMADRLTGLLFEDGDSTTVSQQNLSKFEKGNNKRLPAWTRVIVSALLAHDGETKEDKHLHLGVQDATVEIKRLPTFVGLGSGGTGDDDEGELSFSRDLIERELRASPQHLLAMVAEGNSMEPEFFGGDMILVDTRRKSLAQPGAFCLWDGDGHVIKFIETIPDTSPLKVRVVSRNPLYEPRERLADDINLVGKVIWFGRRVQ